MSTSPIASPSDTAKALSVGVHEAARITGLSVDWLNQMRSKSTGPRYVKVGRRALYLIADLEAWLTANAVGRAA